MTESNQNITLPSLKVFVQNFLFCNLLLLFSLISVYLHPSLLKSLLVPFFIFSPGVLIFNLFNSRTHPLLIKFSFTLAYSILFLYLVALINVFFVSKFLTYLPLDIVPISLTYTALFLLTVFFLSLKAKTFLLAINYLDKPKIFAYLPSVILPLIGISGALLINNGYGNSVTITSYVIIFLMFSVHLYRSRRTSDSTFAFFLLCASMAMLFSYSFRSQHISGYDISQEYKFFRETLSQLNWVPSQIYDAYQACLSITVLPTIIAKVTSISDEYVFKFLMVSSFAIIPVNIYYAGRKFFSKDISMAGAFFFLSQYWYIAQLPTIIRQGTAYIFYSLIIFLVFDEKDSKVNKNISFVLLGLGLILSHYSTTYIFVGLFITVKLFLIAMKFIKLHRIYNFLATKIKIPINQYIDLDSDISVFSVVILLTATLLWFGLVTKTLPDLSKKLGINGSGSHSVSINDLSSKLAQTLSYNFKPTNDVNTPAAYLKDRTENLYQTRPYLFPNDSDKNVIISDDFSFTNVQQLTPPLEVSNQVKSAFIVMFRLSRLLLNNLLLPIGIVLILFVKSKKSVSVQYVLISGALLALILGLTLSPSGLGSYNIERLYLQLLISGSMMTVWTIFKIFSYKKFNMLAIFVCLLLQGFYFFFYTGMSQLVVGGNQAITLFNEGSDYYKNYTHTSEVFAARWISPYIKSSFVFADSPGRNRLLAYSDADSNKIISPILPTTLNKSSYVFLAFHNEVKNVVIDTNAGVNIFLPTPKKTLNANKNLIYSNGKESIYK